MNIWAQLVVEVARYEWKKKHPCQSKLCAFWCLISRPQILNLRSRNQICVKLLLSRKLRHFRGSRFSLVSYPHGLPPWLPWEIDNLMGERHLLLRPNGHQWNNPTSYVSLNNRDPSWVNVLALISIMSFLPNLTQGLFSIIAGADHGVSTSMSWSTFRNWITFTTIHSWTIQINMMRNSWM